MKTTEIRRSESYPKYYLIRRDETLHVALKLQDKDQQDEGDEFLSCGVLTHEENFETACDDLDETYRCLLADFGF